MRKSVIGCCVCLFLVAVFVSAVNLWSYNGKSNSEKNNNERTTAKIVDFETKYGYGLKLATKEIEKRTYGIWQANDCFGYDNSTKIQGDGILGHSVVFNAKAFIDMDISWSKPVFAYYTESVKDMETDSFLHLTCLDDRYAQSEGIVIIVMNSIPTNYGAVSVDNQLTLIIINNMLIMESQESYWKLTKTD